MTFGTGSILEGLVLDIVAEELWFIFDTKVD
jgi:hypothetical protein